MHSTKAKPFTERKTATAHIERWRHYGAEAEQRFESARQGLVRLSAQRESVERMMISELLVDVKRIEATDYMERYHARSALYDTLAAHLGVSRLDVRRMVFCYLGEAVEAAL